MRHCEVCTAACEDRKAADPRPTAGERSGALLPVAESVVGVTMTQTRDWENVMIRRFIAFRMRKEGYLLRDIADAMGKNHSTVVHYVRQMRDCFDEPVFYANDLNLYLSFDAAAEEAERHVE